MLLKTIASLIILIAIAVFAPMPATAQEQVRGKIPQGWERLFPAEAESSAEFIALVSEGRTVVVGYDVIPGKPNDRVWVRMLDPYGELIWERYLDPKLDSFDAALVSNNTIYVLADTFNRIYPHEKVHPDVIASHLFALDFQGNLLWSKNQYPDDNNLLLAMCVDNNGDLLLAGNLYLFTKNKKTTLKKITSGGNHIWTKITGFGNYYYAIDSVKQLPNNTIVTLGTVYKFGKHKNHPQFNLLVFYDSEGQEFKRVHLGLDHTVMHDSIVDLGNNHFMIFTYIKAPDTGEHGKIIPTACFLVYDYEGNQVSAFKYDITPEGWHLEDVIRVPNNYFLSTEPRFFSQNGLDVCLNLIDSKGEIKAQHFYHRQFRDLVSRIAYSPDGYLLLAGAQGVDHIGRLEAWVAKLPIPQAMQQLIANPRHQQ